MQWFCFWGYGLSIECVVAHPFHLFPFPPSVKVLAFIEIAVTLYSFTQLNEVTYMYSEVFSLQIF